MKITEVRVFPVTHEDERLAAFATITFDECFVVRDLRVIRGIKGLFVAMPSRKRQDGTYSDVAHPLNAEMRQEIEDQVVAEYEREMKLTPSQRSTSDSAYGTSAQPVEGNKIPPGPNERIAV